MVAPVARPAYRAQLHALMPRGRAWPHHQDSVLSSLLDAFAARLAALDAAASALIDDQLATRTRDLLPEWETDVGLPDECSALASTLSERRAAVVTKLIAQPDLSPSAFIAIAEDFGVTITVEHLDQARADAIANLDTTNGKWRFVWWIGIPGAADTRYFTTESTCDTPLSETERNTELECRLRKAAPLHTFVAIEYT